MDTLRLDKPPRFIARQLALGFGTVSIVAVVMCGMLLGIIFDVSKLISGMRHDESSIRQGFEVSAAVRELSIHIAHTLIEGDESHLGHYEEWRERIRIRIEDLSNRVPEAERFRAKDLQEKVDELHQKFISNALSAAKNGDLKTVRALHPELEKLGQEAANDADALARAAESKMVHAHVLATDSTQLGLLGGGLCVALVVLLSVGFTFRLRAAVLKPLLVLTDAARRFGQGDFALRVGEVGKGELAALGDAFDHMAEELGHREARLLHAERMAAIGQLAAGIAHELNNPIGIIRGYLKTMTPESDPETLKDELGILDEEAAQCQRIADDLVSYARTKDLKFDRGSIKAVLQETAKRFSETVIEKNQKVFVEVQDEDIEADAPRLRQVLLNLLRNGSQVSPEGSTLFVRGHVVGGTYQVEVEDQGPGIPAEDRMRVFEPFFSKRRGGTGLGLSVCEGIVRAHGGTIEALASETGGAVFRFTVPVVQKPVEADSSEVAA